ncbi:MAG TPA: MBL fold metallo-hydrolase [Solirubrobacteraceae bacterium]|nr:MBL fold metallo-hydrolase [Solirubrobacteraceae bacterium]
MSTRIRFLGIAGYEIVSDAHRILVDPCLSAQSNPPLTPDELEAPDVILVSHAAFDHYGDTAAIAQRTGAPVVCGADVRLALLEHGIPHGQIRQTTWGIVVEVGGVVVRPVECHHWSSIRLADGSTVTGSPMAFIVEPEPGVRIYHYGDTALYDMRLIGELYEPTVGLLGCAQPLELVDETAAGRLLTGEMSPDEAARAAEMLGVQVAVASHYLERTPEVDEFVRLVAEHDTTAARQAVAPDVGDVIVLQNGVASVERREPEAIR